MDKDIKDTQVRYTPVYMYSNDTAKIPALDLHGPQCKSSSADI
jgi:hypothetical protein